LPIVTSLEIILTIAPKALLSDGLLDVVIVKKTAKPLLLYNIIKQILVGKREDGNFIKASRYLFSNKTTVYENTSWHLSISTETL
jgi:diacylglycerol kinase family enzyme